MGWRSSALVFLLAGTHSLIASSQPTCDTNNIVPEGQDCSAAPNCCPSGSFCYRKSRFWSGCLASCTPGFVDNFDNFKWECRLLTGNTDDCDEENLSPVSNQGYAQKNGRLSVNGQSVTNQQGEKIQLTGVAGKIDDPTCVSTEAITHLVTDWAANLFRIQLRTNTADELDAVRSVVQLAQSLGIYVMISALVPDQTQAIQFWLDLSNTYGNNVNVLFNIQTAAETWAQASAYHNAILSTVRQTNQNSIFVLDTDKDNSKYADVVSAPVPTNQNVMYSFSFSTGTTEQIASTSLSLPLFLTSLHTPSKESGQFGELTALLDFLGGLRQGREDTKIGYSYDIFSDSRDIDNSRRALRQDACAEKKFDQLTCSGRYISKYIKKTHGAKFVPASEPIEGLPVPPGEEGSTAESSGVSDSAARAIAITGGVSALGAIGVLAVQRYRRNSAGHKVSASSMSSKTSQLPKQFGFDSPHRDSDPGIEPVPLTPASARQNRQPYEDSQSSSKPSLSEAQDALDEFRPRLENRSVENPLFDAHMSSSSSRSRSGRSAISSLMSTISSLSSRSSGFSFRSSGLSSVSSGLSARSSGLDSTRGPGAAFYDV